MMWLDLVCQKSTLYESCPTITGLYPVRDAEE